MSYTPQEDGAKFMTMCGQEVKTSPSLPSRKILLLRAKLNFEETLEFVKAAGCFIGVNEHGDLDVFEDFDETPDLVGIYDGLVDTLYVSYGALSACGLDAEAGWDEVQRSNMSKANADGSITKNEFGKVIKAPTYSPADLKSIIDKQVK